MKKIILIIALISSSCDLSENSKNKKEKNNSPASYEVKSVNLIYCDIKSLIGESKDNVASEAKVKIFSCDNEDGFLFSFDKGQFFVTRDLKFRQSDLEKCDNTNNVFKCKNVTAEIENNYLFIYEGLNSKNDNVLSIKNYKEKGIYDFLYNYDLFSSKNNLKDDLKIIQADYNFFYKKENYDDFSNSLGLSLNDFLKKEMCKNVKVFDLNDSFSPISDSDFHDLFFNQHEIQDKGLICENNFGEQKYKVIARFAEDYLYYINIKLEIESENFNVENYQNILSSFKNTIKFSNRCIPFNKSNSDIKINASIDTIEYSASEGYYCPYWSQITVFFRQEKYINKILKKAYGEHLKEMERPLIAISFQMPFKKKDISNKIKENKIKFANKIKEEETKRTPKLLK